MTAPVHDTASGRDGRYGEAATAAMGRLLQDFQRMQRERDQALNALEEAYRDRLRLAMAAEFASDEGAAHLVRVGCLAERLALACGVAADEARCLRNAAFLFGIGLRDVPVDARTPAAAGGLPEPAGTALSDGGAPRLGRDGLTPLELGAEVAYAWRERWDGTGAPEGLAGDAIPLSARLVTLANLVDGLRRADRAGPLAWPQVLGVAQAGAGRQFDPALVAHLIAVQAELADLMDRLDRARPSLAELARHF